MWFPLFFIYFYSNAKDCKATRHCIQTVWEKQPVPVDTDSICQICKDMVTQARDQLRSNETEEELKEVFEGSCKLIPVKLVQKECIALADNFVPELVEALSSEMNPDVSIHVIIEKDLYNYFNCAITASLLRRWIVQQRQS